MKKVKKKKKSLKSKFQLKDIPWLGLVLLFSLFFLNHGCVKYTLKNPTSASASSSGSGSLFDGYTQGQVNQIIADMGNALLGTDGTLTGIAEMYEEFDIITHRN